MVEARLGMEKAYDDEREPPTDARERSEGSSRQPGDDALSVASAATRGARHILP
jgi:hypothetical protein